MFGLSRNSSLHKATPPGTPSSATPGGWMLREEAIMGTAIRVELWSESPVHGEAAIKAVMAEMHRIDHTMSPYKASSELSLVNRDAAVRDVPLSHEMFQLLARAEHFSRMSEGAFDITYAAVGRLFDYRLHRRPSAAELAQARNAVGYQYLVLDALARTVRFAKPGMCIDLGGFAKGHAVDNAAAILRQHGIQHAHVSAGGDSRVIGDRRGRPWSIGVRDPRKPTEVVAILPLEDTSISTSGDYERFFEESGQRYHHLIDPASGESPRGIRSVTVLAEDGLTTEALSKSVFVMGLEKGMRLIEALSGIDVVVVDATGTLHFSSGLMTPAAQTNLGRPLCENL